MTLPMAAAVTLQKLKCSGAEIAAPSRNVTRMLETWQNSPVR